MVLAFRKRFHERFERCWLSKSKCWDIRCRCRCRMSVLSAPLAGSARWELRVGESTSQDTKLSEIQLWSAHT